jgi:hypothetical protein
LEKFARALEVPIYQLIFEGKEPPLPAKFGRGFSRMHESDLRLPLGLAQKTARQKAI